MTPDPTIDRCPVCGKPTHATEGDGLGRCSGCSRLQEAAPALLKALRQVLPFLAKASQAGTFTGCAVPKGAARLLARAEAVADHAQGLSADREPCSCGNPDSPRKFTDPRTGVEYCGPHCFHAAMLNLAPEERGFRYAFEAENVTHRGACARCGDPVPWVGAVLHTAEDVWFCSLSCFDAAAEAEEAR